METRTEGSMLEKVFFGLGYLLEELDGVASGKGSAVLAKGLEALDPDRDDRELPASLALAAAGWLAAKVLRPRRIRWHRAVAAGIAATVLEELTRRRTGQAGDDADGVGPVNRFAAGIGAAAAYAALFYPRLPGPPLARGLLFGTLRAALAPEGGPVVVAQRLIPELDLPLQHLAESARPTPGLVPNLAFGLGLGLVYRDGSR